MIGDTSEDVGEPGLRIDVVHFCGDDERIHNRGALPTAIGAGEEPRLAPESNRPFILPVSDKMLKSFIAGTLILVAASV